MGIVEYKITLYICISFKNKYKQLKIIVMKTVEYICYNAGCDIYVVEKFNESIDWHKDEFIGTYEQCIREKQEREYEAYRFINCLPHLSNC